MLLLGFSGSDFLHSSQFPAKANNKVEGKKPAQLGRIDTAGDRDKLYRLGPNEQGFYLRTDAEPSLRKAVLNKKTRRWIMSRKSVIVVIYHRHELPHLTHREDSET
jgi:hypothetical protein